MVRREELRLQWRRALEGGGEHQLGEEAGRVRAAPRPHQLGDRQLGFADEALAGLLEGAGLADVKVTVGSRGTGDPFTVLVASGVRPAADGKRLRTKEKH